jgi:hypothetical protein
MRLECQFEILVIFSLKELCYYKCLGFFIIVYIVYGNLRILFRFFFVWILSTSAAHQRPAHGNVSSPVTTHLRTDRVCQVLGRSWIRPQDY